MREIIDTNEPMNKAKSIEINWIHCFSDLDCLMSPSQEVMNCKFLVYFGSILKKFLSDKAVVFLVFPSPLFRFLIPSLIFVSLPTRFPVHVDEVLQNLPPLILDIAGGCMSTTLLDVVPLISFINITENTIKFVCWWTFSSRIFESQVKLLLNVLADRLVASLSML